MDIPFRKQIIGASKTRGGKSPSMLPGNSSKVLALLLSKGKITVEKKL
jgi:hypothetical protein